MSAIRYIVTGLPRSGTKYIATVLSKLGLNCGHECCFSPNKAIFEKEGDAVFGDASWMAVPYIKELPAGSIVFHQLRDPIKVLNSNLPIGGDSYFRTWDENAGLSTDPLYKKAIPWKRFLWENTLDWSWPYGVATCAGSAEEIQRLVHWWINWNLWIEYATLCRADLVYIRYKLEDLNDAFLQNMATVINPHKSITLKECSEVLFTVSKTTNRHRIPNTAVTRAHLTPAAKMMLYRYRYDKI